MKKFLLKGIIRDRSRSTLPVIVVSLGVLLTVILYTWLTGIMGDSIELGASFNTGHVKVMTQAYAEEAEQTPNDLALMGTGEIMNDLNNRFPELDWVERIRFGVLVDFPDEKGETRAQGPAAGWAVDLLSGNSNEIQRLQIEQSLFSGWMPREQGEALISHDFASKMNAKPGDVLTIFGSTMEGGMAFKNLKIAGTIQFGSTALDRGAILMDISDARDAFEMEDAAGEILGFFKKGIFNQEKSLAIKEKFNQEYLHAEDEFSPVMLTLLDQEGMAELYSYSQTIGGMMVVIFVLAMSLVLWNAGLLGGLRRYREFGIRLAVGESKSHIFRSLISEGLIIGLIGSLTGTILGLAFAYYVQNVGINIGSMMKNSSMLIPSVIRTNVTLTTWIIGFFPGVLSMILGNTLAGIGIFKRKTSQLIKELEV